MDSLLELDERNVWVRVNYGKRGPGLRMCFSAWYREKAEAIIMIRTTKTFTYTFAFKWNVVLPSCIDMSIFYLFRYVSNRAHGPLTSWELGRVSVDMILFEVCNSSSIFFHLTCLRENLYFMSNFIYLYLITYFK